MAAQVPDLCPDCGASWRCEHQTPAAHGGLTLIPADHADMTRHLGGNAGATPPAATAGVAGGSSHASPRDSQATRLVQLVTDLGIDLFHSPDGTAHGTFTVEEHLETHALRTKAFRQYMARRYYLDYESAPNSQALQDALTVLEGRALFEGPEHPVHVRRAEADGRLVIDLGTPTWEVVVVDAQGWRVGRNQTIRFRRPPGMLPLALPVHGGSITELRPFLNVNGDDFTLVVAWEVQATRGIGPYPVLPLIGEQGAGKSTAARVLRALLDPNAAPIRAEPKEPRDLIIAATNSAVVALDNLSHLPAWLSDGLCRISTGGGYATRALYTDDEERLFEAMRPILLNGIEEFVTRSDLLDRSVIVHLEQVRRRLPEAEFWATFAAAAPRILGALLTGVSRSLRDGAAMHIDPLPRMADFAVNAAAAMPAFGWTATQFLDAYTAQRREVSELPLEASPIWPPLQTLLQVRAGKAPLWEGTATALLDALAALVGEAATRRRGWPGNGRALSNMLRRLAPNLRGAGYEVRFGVVGDDRRRVITFTGVPDRGPEPCDHSDRLDQEAKAAREPAMDPIPADSGPIATTGDPAAVAIASAPRSTLGEPASIARIAPIATSRPNSASSTPSPDALALAVRTDQVSFVTTAAELQAALPHLLAADMVGLDCETTGLNPRSDRLRLVQVATADQVVVVDCFAVNPRTLAPVFAGRGEFVGHNLTFDLAFLAAAGLPVPGNMFDTMLASQLLHAGLAAPQGTHTLAGLVKRLFDYDMVKREQRSDWTGPLSERQIAYAATDAAVLLPLAEALRDQLASATLQQVAAIEMHALPAVLWLEQTGAPFDREAWMHLSDAATDAVLRLEEDLTACAGTADLLGKSAVTWTSPVQVATLLRQRGHDVQHADESALQALAAHEPLAPLLLAHREASKRAGTYGIAFLNHVDARSGRIHADLLQLGSVAGRMSCTRPNLQNILRDAAYRACFRPARGRVLVKADYSQIELRIAAQLSRDPALLAAYRDGADVHARTAAAVLGQDVVSITKSQRQLAKALNFGLLYGMGPARLRAYAANDFGVTLSEAEAVGHRDRFFQRYRGLRRWHRAQPDGVMETRTLAARRRMGVEKFTEKLNSPIQGTGADILKLALARLWDDRHRQPSACPVLCVHDEIVVECDVAHAEAVAAWLKRHMEAAGAALLPDVPVVVDVTIAADWSGTPVGEPGEEVQQ